MYVGHRGYNSLNSIKKSQPIRLKDKLMVLASIPLVFFLASNLIGNFFSGAVNTENKTVVNAKTSNIVSHSKETVQQSKPSAETSKTEITKPKYSNLLNINLNYVEKKQFKDTGKIFSKPKITKIASTIPQIRKELISGIRTEKLHYEVKPGDTLWSLSKRYNTTPEAIMTINNLHSASSLAIGQALIIEKKRILIKYQVKPGETLYKIARTHHVSINELIEQNPSLTRETILRIGQELIIQT